MRSVSRHLSILLICLGFLLPAGFVSGALAQSFTSMCKGDDALVGVANAVYVVTNRSGNPMQPQMTPVYINFAIASCAPLEGGKPGTPYTAPTPIVFPTLPLTQASGSGAKTCGSGRLVTVLQGTNAGGMVNDFRFGCTEQGGGNVRFTKGPANADFEEQCGRGQYANGITAVPTGNIGFAELSLKCVRFRASRDDQNGRGDDDDDDDDHGGRPGSGGVGGFTFGDLQFQIELNGATVEFGNRGKVRTVREPTTIYRNKGGDEIDYLERGDRVTVVACENNGRGWCAIIRPEVGYVWGRDLR